MNENLTASSCGDEEEIEIVSEVDDNYKIRVLTSDYLANGGDKMIFFKNKKQITATNNYTSFNLGIISNLNLKLKQKQMITF